MKVSWGPGLRYAAAAMCLLPSRRRSRLETRSRVWLRRAEFVARGRPCTPTAYAPKTMNRTSAPVDAHDRSIQSWLLVRAEIRNRVQLGRRRPLRLPSRLLVEQLRAWHLRGAAHGVRIERVDGLRAQPGPLIPLRRSESAADWSLRTGGWSHPRPLPSEDAPRPPLRPRPRRSAGGGGDRGLHEPVRLVHWPFVSAGMLADGQVHGRIRREHRGR